ncbi:MAG TPA: hypothetical protein VGF23_01905 [Gaiellaceae bacterium]|jgi:hypothetical protein
MPLANPQLQAVQAGSPVTADSWNAILGRILNTLPVRVTVQGAPFGGARVVAIAEDGGEGAVAIEAVPPYPGVDSYTVVGVTSGTWKVVAYTGLVHADPVTVTLPGDGRPEPFVADWVAIDLKGRLMPDLTGMSVPDALRALSGVGVQLDANKDTVFDVMTGLAIDIGFFMSDPVYVAGARIGWHEPSPGELFDPGNSDLRVFCGSPTGWTSVPDIDDGTSFADAEGMLRDATLFVSPKSRAEYEQNQSKVVRATDPQGGSTNRPLGAYVDLILRTP